MNVLVTLPEKYEKEIEYAKQLYRIGDTRRLQNMLEHYRDTCERDRAAIVQQFTTRLPRRIQDIYDIDFDQIPKLKADTEFDPEFDSKADLLDACKRAIEQAANAEYSLTMTGCYAARIVKYMKVVSGFLHANGFAARKVIRDPNGQAVIHRDTCYDRYLPSIHAIKYSKYLYKGFAHLYPLIFDNNNKPRYSDARQLFNHMNKFTPSYVSYIKDLLKSRKLFSGRELAYFTMFVLEELMRWGQLIACEAYFHYFLKLFYECKNNPVVFTCAEWRDFKELESDLLKLYEKVRNQEFN